MALYYEDDLVQLHHGDARGIRGWTQADVLVTDPPYGTGWQGYGRGGRTIENDLDTTCRDDVLELWGARPAAVFGSPRMPEPPGDWVDRLVWDKRRIGMNGGPWRYRHESIWVRGFQRISDDAASILSAFPADQQWHIHAKPVALMEHLIERAPVGVIADPFAGSGSTLIAARNLGRRCIGVELDEAYCAVIVKRLAQQAFDFTLLEPPVVDWRPETLEGTP